VGWVPTNVQITCFDGIAESPFGSLGDLLLVPDPSAEVKVALTDGRTEHFMLGDIVTLDGDLWEFCTRALLRTALDRLHALSGARLFAASATLRRSKIKSTVCWIELSRPVHRL